MAETVDPVVDPTLKFLVDSLEDIEKARIAMENRYRTLTQEGVSEDGHPWGFGMDPSLPEPQALYRLLENFDKEGKRIGGFLMLEEQAIKSVQKSMRASALGAFVKDAKGVGEKQAARLLGVIGDPYWHYAENRPRTVSELWAYCGLDVREGRAPRRTKGQQSNWNSDARKRAWLVAKSVEKQTSGKYREIYDATKAHYAGAIHIGYDCAQCHAKDGAPLKPGHIQSRALRKVAKAVLKDLWIASRDFHQSQQQKAA